MDVELFQIKGTVGILILIHSHNIWCERVQDSASSNAYELFEGAVLCRSELVAPDVVKHLRSSAGGQ